MGLTGKCCDNGNFETAHVCQKHDGYAGSRLSFQGMPPKDLMAQGTGVTKNVVISSPGSLCICRGGYRMENGERVAVNGAGVPLAKLNRSTGRPRGARNLNAKHPSSIARAFKKAGLDWAQDFALAIKAAGSMTPKERIWGRERIKLWLKLLPYLITTTNKVRVKRWKGKASKAALIALDALEGKK